MTEQPMHQLTRPLTERMHEALGQALIRWQQSAANLGVPPCAYVRAAAMAVHKLNATWAEAYVDTPCPEHDNGGDGPCPPRKEDLLDG